ncbi:hypothetical protein BDQ17DRAFT_1546624 [Cyathus striatus]|nr:hypothetical protein BDQ17DRAFT_1546624 [Cyathus striatus]
MFYEPIKMPTCRFVLYDSITNVSAYIVITIVTIYSTPDTEDGEHAEDETLATRRLEIIVRRLRTPEVELFNIFDDAIAESRTSEGSSAASHSKHLILVLEYPGFWENHYGSPKDVELDRGPWPDVPSYLKSITNSEHAWITKYAKAPTRKFVAPWEPHSHLQVPQDHLHLLSILTLRDSNQGSIFLSREAFESDVTVEISAVIDWQHTAVLPLYLTVLIPSFIQVPEPAPDQEEDAFLKEQAYLHKAYHTLYRETELDIVLASALSFDGKVTTAQQLPSAAQYCWHGSNPILKQQLIRVMVNWEGIAGTGVVCPLSPESLSELEIAQAKEGEHAWEEMESAQSDIDRHIGVGSDGWVVTEGYDRAVQASDDLCKEWMANIEKGDLGEVDLADIWPYRGEVR